MKHTRIPKRVSFSPNDVNISEISSRKLIAKFLANHHAKAYEFSHFVVDAKPTALLTHGNEVSRLWHERFGHLNFKYLQQLHKNSMVEGLPVIKATTGICKGCVIGKHPEHKFNRGKANRAASILWLIHSDIIGPIIFTYMNGSRYLITFIDDFSRYTWVFFLKNKSEVCEIFFELKALIKNASGLKIKILISNNGGEYVSNYFLSIFSQSGIHSNIQFPTLPSRTE